MYQVCTSGHVTTARRSVAIKYLLRKTSQNIETDCSLFQNSNKRPFFSRFIVQPRSLAGQCSALLLTPSKNPLHAIQKCNLCTTAPSPSDTVHRLKKWSFQKFFTHESIFANLNFRRSRSFSSEKLERKANPEKN